LSGDNTTYSVVFSHSNGTTRVVKTGFATEAEAAAYASFLNGGVVPA
jgi:hypothetical protein